MSSIRESKRLTLGLLALLLLLLFVAAQRGQLQAASACDAPLTSLYILQADTTVSAEGVAAANEWVLDGSRYQEAYGRPEYTIYGRTDTTRAGRRYLLVYPSSADADAVVVFDFTYDRMFGKHDDPELRHHPDCAGGVMDRSNLDALLGG
jgi:hypothetical protein